MPRWVATAIVGFLFGCATSAPTPGLPKNPVGLRYRGYDGTFKSLGALRGKPVLVEVIATYAGPALVEVERIRPISAGYGSRLQVVLLVLDEQPEMAAVFAEIFEVAESVGRVEDPRRFVSEEGPFGPIGVVPTGVLLGPDGRIAVRSDGPWPKGVLEEALQALIGPPEARGHRTD